MTPIAALSFLAVALGAAVFAYMRNGPMDPDGFRREYPREHRPYPLTPRQMRAAMLSRAILGAGIAQCRAILSASPVDTGRARASWRAEKVAAMASTNANTLAAIVELSRPSDKAAKALRELGLQFDAFRGHLAVMSYPLLRVNRPLGPHTTPEQGAMDGRPWREGDRIPEGMHVRLSPLDPGPPVLDIAQIEQERDKWDHMNRLRWYGVAPMDPTYYIQVTA